MRLVGALVLVAACTSSDPSGGGKQTYKFGPFSIAPGEEVTGRCVQIDLHNSDDLYINTIDLETGPGFHHSNWFFIPEHFYADQPDVFPCDETAVTVTAAVNGGVLFAQSTQLAMQTQAFPEGVAIHIPPHSKLLAQIHLLNPGDSTLKLSPTISLTPLAKKDVTTVLAAISFENHALGLPPNQQSRFTLDCDLAPLSQQLYDQGEATSATPDWKIYYALAHYHALGTGLTLEAVKPDGSATQVFTTANRVGDALGAAIDPQFDMTGYTRLRFSCDYYNNTAATVPWGVGTNEMCVFLAFSDSKFNWGGGVTSDDAPGTPTDVNGVMSYTHACQVLANDASR
ncbi:MAG TPA: hypothetical protein VLT45_18885 [Kofleriaceae bacterium]|nr:hypothetical protein [Kofleriaceae bacterium]